MPQSLGVPFRLAGVFLFHLSSHSSIALPHCYLFGTNCRRGSWLSLKSFLWGTLFKLLSIFVDFFFFFIVIAFKWSHGTCSVICVSLRHRAVLFLILVEQECTVTNPCLLVIFNAAYLFKMYFIICKAWAQVVRCLDEYTVDVLFLHCHCSDGHHSTD